MPNTIKFSDNPNEETAFVTTEDNTRTRAVVTATVEGTVKFPDNPNSTKVNVTVDGVEHKAVAVYNLNGGGGGDVSSVNGKTGAVVLDAKDVEAVPQEDTLPTASAQTAGSIVQYSGATIPDVEESATIAQTVGSTLSGLAVDLDTFVGVEQPTGDETVDFVCSSIVDSMSQTSGSEGGMTVVINDVSKFISQLQIDAGITVDEGSIISVLAKSGPVMFAVEFRNSIGQSSSVWDRTSEYFSDYGIEVSGESASSGTWERTISGSVYSKLASWEKDETAVNLATYGISYSGTPVVDDTLTVAYTAPVVGITNGYFYKCGVEYSDPTATINQTVGSGLTDLAVNVETFIETEQPTQDETVAFVANVTADSVVTSPINDWVITVDSTAIVNAILALYPNYDMSRISNGWINYCENDNDAILGWNDDVPYQVDVSNAVTIVVRGQGDADQYVTIASVDSITKSVTTWEKDSETVDLAEYGISYTGTPVDDDTLTVDYTAPAPIGYYWIRTDVQPSSGGGNAGIEWKTKSDLEVGYNGYRYLTIPSGLPNGIYEYYIQIKRTTSEFGYTPLGYVTYKIVMKIDNDNQQYRALVNPVLDGDYATTVYAQLRDTGEVQTIYISGSDMTFSLMSFRTNISDYSPAETIVDCYKLSAIKNVDTNQEYVGTLSNTEPQYEEIRSISYLWGTVDQLPYVPKYAGTGTLYFENGDYVTVSDKYYASNTVMLRIGFRAGFDEYQADMALYRNGHSIKVRKATGVFAQTEFVKDEDGKILIKLNAPVGTTGSFVYVIGGISEDSIGNMSMQTPTGTPTVLSTDMVGSVVDTNNIDIISQYVGTTTASYTNGCFYKATGTVVTIPESAVCTETSSTGTTITCTNVSGLINKLSSLTGWSTEYVKESLGWSFFGISQDQTSVYYSAYGTWYGQDAADLIACFSFSPALSDSIDFNVRYVPATQEVQNGAWVLVDTQFTGITGYDATKTQVLKNVQGVMTWVDEV